MVIGLWDLSLNPALQAGFSIDAASQEAYHSWDTYSLICNSFKDLVFLYFLVSHTPLKRVSTFHVASKSLLLGAQALQLWMIMRRPKLYYKLRVPLAVMLRMCRSLFVVNRFWQRGPRPSSCSGYAAYRTAISASWYSYNKVVPALLLLEPFGTMMSVMREHLPMKLNAAALAFRAAVQLQLGVPALSCVLMHPQLQTRTRNLCPYVVSWISMQPVGDSVRAQLQDLCGRPAALVYIPSVLLLLIGIMTPFLACYWYELKIKMDYVVSAQPSLASQLPDAAALGQLLLLQLWGCAGLAVACAYMFSLQSDRLGLDTCGASD